MVISRALTWALLSFGALAAYLLLVTLLDRLLSEWTGRSVLATLVVALLVGPLYPRLQRLVEQATYGERRDPARVMSSVAPHLHADGSSFAAVAASLADTLRMPYVAVLDTEGRTLGETGRPGDQRHEVELRHADRAVGTLVLGLRPGERSLSDKDARGVALLTAPLALALHATSLTEEVRVSQERMVTAVEEERRRLRRELHDDLGPVLTGLALASDAAANLRATDPEPRRRAGGPHPARGAARDRQRAAGGRRTATSGARRARPRGRAPATSRGAVLPQRRQPARRTARGRGAARAAGSSGGRRVSDRDRGAHQRRPARGRVAGQHHASLRRGARGAAWSTTERAAPPGSPASA